MLPGLKWLTARLNSVEYEGEAHMETMPLLL